MTDIKIDQHIYYTNKPAFTTFLKRFKLKWGTKVIDNITIEGWFNDTPDYVQKLPEEGNFKRFHIKGCQEIADFLLSLSAISPSTQPTKLPWEAGKFWEYRKKILLDSLDPNFKVKWS